MLGHRVRILWSGMWDQQSAFWLHSYPVLYIAMMSKRGLCITYHISSSQSSFLRCPTFLCYWIVKHLSCKLYVCKHTNSKITLKIILSIPLFFLFHISYFLLLGSPWSLPIMSETECTSCAVSSAVGQLAFRRLSMTLDTGRTNSVQSSFVRGWIFR